MTAFSPTHVAAAVRRLPAQSSAEVRRVKDRAQQIGLTDLVQACDAELQARPFDFGTEQAETFTQMGLQVRDLGLADTIRYAFTVVRPADQDEIRFLSWLSAHPDGSYQAAMKQYGKGDLSLVIGHLVYHRYGCFKKFMQDGSTQSDVLLERLPSADGVRYRLRPEAEQVFKDIGLI